MSPTALLVPSASTSSNLYYLMNVATRKRFALQTISVALLSTNSRITRIWRAHPPREYLAPNVLRNSSWVDRAEQ
jgi:hypothetical protein